MSLKTGINRSILTRRVAYRVITWSRGPKSSYLSILKEGVKEQFEREIDINKSYEDLENVADVLYDAFKIHRQPHITQTGKSDIKGLISEVNNRWSSWNKFI